MSERNLLMKAYNDAWRKLKKAHLAAHPLCVLCAKEGKKRKATQANHIVPFNNFDDSRRIDKLNLQSLCAPCHKKKTRKETEERFKIAEQAKAFLY